MRKSSLLYIAFGLMVALGALHFLASFWSLYWTVWWFDYLMHFLGGVIAGLLVIWFFRIDTTRIRRALVLTLVSVIIIGVLWEVFEYIYDIAGSTEPYGADTINDLVMDLLGGVTAIIIARLRQPS